MQSNRDGGAKRYAFVSGAVQDVEFETIADDCRRIRAPEARQCRAGIERTGIEEIRTQTTRFQREFTETQCVIGQRELNKLALIKVYRGADYSSPVGKRVSYPRRQQPAHS